MTDHLISDTPPARGRRLGLSEAVVAGIGRLGWGLADQGMSSLTNFAVGIVVARSLGAVEFGVFSLAWVTYGVALNLSRGLATDPLTVRFSGVEVSAWRAAVARSSGTALTIGVGLGALCALASLALGERIGAGFLGLGLVLPALLLQDSWRYAFFAKGEGRRAFANDAVWGIALVASLLLTVGDGNVFEFMLAWGVAAGVAALFGILQTRILPRPAASRGWVREQRDLGVRYLVENVSGSGAAQLRIYGLGAIAGLSAVGAVRGGELLMGPFLAVLMGLSQVAVPEAARILRRAPRRLPRFCLLLGSAQSLAALLWGMFLLVLLPDSVGSGLLGEIWPVASTLIVPLTLTVMSSSFGTSAAAGLRALGAARRSLRAQLIASAGYTVGGILGAVVAGPQGSAWGLAIALTLSAGVWWWQLQTALQARLSRGDTEPPTIAPANVAGVHGAPPEEQPVARPDDIRMYDEETRTP